ncbi:penicillin-binding transpeptidase domain-containing protein [Micromonospora sp. NPDC050397]|uniref:penicillin-binding transpeptidase domain-containing protein n=1 Tax=Micromonospora sp. NPDC050397 TaxID=3364279 RepID=UPI00384DDC74
MHPYEQRRRDGGLRPPTTRLRRPILAALAALGLLTGSLAGCSGQPSPEQAVDDFLGGWRDGKLDQFRFLDDQGQQITGAKVLEEIKFLAGDLPTPAVRRNGDASVGGDAATAKLTVDWTLPGGTHWAYPTAVRLKRDTEDQWRIIWEPRIAQEKLTEGDQLTVRRVAAPRGQILDGAGQPIVAPRSIIVIGVQPSEVSDVPALVKELEAAFKAIRPAITPAIELDDLPEQIKQAKPDAFVEVVSLRKEAYQQIKPRIYDLPGTKFREEQRELAPTREFARALLGSVDPAQKEDLDANPGVYVATDMIGHGGLQGRYEKPLRGTPGSTVVISRRNDNGQLVPTDTELFRTEPTPGTPLKTTIDVKTQSAADAALAPDSHRTALVAVRISDGSVLATANGPGGGAENLALTAQVPPGSTFKMVSALGLLDQNAVSLDGKVACPKTFTVDGRSFKNANDFELGDVPFRTDFAKSCNTAFAALAPKLGDTGLAETGRTLGLEAKWELGVEAFTGKISTGGSAAERAAAAFGQGTNLVSPIAMAAATAAVAKGQWQQPKLVLDPAPAGSAPVGPQLKPTSVEPLRTMMREVVTAGSATALKNVPGGPVHGKTGTAEYDNNPAHTHAWFVGWQGDVAFAVFVENGGGSGDTAVPIADRFLRNLAAR